MMSATVSSAISDYEVLSLIGEGSFGKVYKAKSCCTNEIVAYKIIGKNGRPASELLTLRRECEIQQHLHHPNIIQMLDSFETENEIVVVTEYAHKGLYDILKEEKVLPECEAQNIICDLVSALYYLHSHRVLHRDLKPQNVLLDVNGVAKLCDFGFARTINIGMQVLTSIKGTPLYMAPELMGENPYDHNADLWSLGCIAYEITVGHPPFTTTSLLHLVRMIKKDSIIWPENLSETFLSFLKGLLQKDPNVRLSWPHLVHHPFVRNKIRIVESNPAALAVMSYTTPHIISRVAHNENVHYSPTLMMPADIRHGTHGCNCYRNYQPCTINQPQNFQAHLPTGISECGEHCNSRYYCCSSANCMIPNNHLPVPNTENSLFLPHFRQRDTSSTNTEMDDSYTSHLELQLQNFTLNEKVSEIPNDTDDGDSECLDSGNGSTEAETEEWLEFLRGNIKDVMSGDIESLSERTFLTMITNVLKNPNVDCSVVEAIAKLLSLPFVVESITKLEMDEIRQLYIRCEVMGDLLSVSKQIVLNDNNTVISATQVSQKHLSCLEPLYVLICNMVYYKDELLQQFYDFSIKLQMASTFRLFLRLALHNARIVMDVLTIFLRVIKDLPHGFSLVESVIFHKTLIGKPSMDFHSLLTNNSDTLRIRTCILIILLVKTHRTELVSIWNNKLTADLVSLKNDSPAISPVAKAAEALIKSSLNVYKR